MSALAVVALVFSAATTALAEPDVIYPSIPVYRLYNQWTYEHFYTPDLIERNNLVEAGWTYESVGWFMVAGSSENPPAPVYRLYNPYAPGGDHHYTMDQAEYEHLQSVGWIGEGMGWMSDGSQTVPVYREYNPFEFAHNHNYTANAEEHNRLVSLGWNDEGIGWYGSATPSTYWGESYSKISSIEIVNAPTTLPAGSQIRETMLQCTTPGVKLASYQLDDSGGQPVSMNNPPAKSYYYGMTLPEAGTELNMLVVISLPSGSVPDTNFTLTINGHEVDCGMGMMQYIDEPGVPNNTVLLLYTDYVITTV